MATHKVKVTGPFTVAGIAPGDEGVIDDAQVAMKPLLDAGLVEVLPEPKKKPATKPKKGDD